MEVDVALRHEPFTPSPGATGGPAQEERVWPVNGRAADGAGRRRFGAAARGAVQGRAGRPGPSEEWARDRSGWRWCERYIGRADGRHDGDATRVAAIGARAEPGAETSRARRGRRSAGGRAEPLFRPEPTGQPTRAIAADPGLVGDRAAYPVGSTAERVKIVLSSPAVGLAPEREEGRGIVCADVYRVGRVVSTPRVRSPSSAMAELGLRGAKAAEELFHCQISFFAGSEVDPFVFSGEVRPARGSSFVFSFNFGRLKETTANPLRFAFPLLLFWIRFLDCWIPS
uniref:Uncharacterized protein n=1 Tax=Setaria viridis TaxID=4556 RepID=A0A4U6UVV6_SETVI|nr:hypothetical protein SEVIR_5G426400v2 [Setaria viridis]